MKNFNILFSKVYTSLERTMILFNIVLIGLLASCSKDNDLEPEKKISTNSIYFSCTINNEFIEFKSPYAKLFSIGKGDSRLNVLKDNPKDSFIIEYSREFFDQKYFIEFRFNNVYLVETNLAWNTPNVKGDLFKKGDYPFQFFSLLDYEKDDSYWPHIGVNIKIFDMENHKIYTSNISPKHCDNLSEYNNFTKNSLFQITNSFPLDSPPKPNDFSGLDITNNWFIEANFKCKLYELGNQFEPNYIENAIYISDGVLKGCF